MFSFLSRVGVGRGSVLKSSVEKVVFGDVEDVFFELEHVEIDADGDAFHDARDGEGEVMQSATCATVRLRRRRAYLFFRHNLHLLC